MIKNIGDKATKYLLRTNPPFNIDQKEGFLELGGSTLFTISFLPTKIKNFNEILNVDLENGQTKQINLYGESHNENVYLSKSYIKMENTYMSLSSSKNIRIVNNTNYPSDLEWKTMFSDKEEKEKKEKLINQVNDQELQEILNINPQTLNYDEESFDSDDSYDEIELAGRRDRLIEVEKGRITRKYNRIRKAIMDDDMLYNDEVFVIEPIKGKINPNSEIIITIMFQPKGPMNYTGVA